MNTLAPQIEADSFSHDQATLHYRASGNGPSQIIWGHGWGVDHKTLMSLAHQFDQDNTNYVVDLPGFGQTPPPPQHWGTEQYADFIAQWLKSLPPQPRFWVGHSFSAKVGMALAARHPTLVQGLFLIGAAGLKRKRTLWQHLVIKTKIYSFKTLKFAIKSGLVSETIKDRFGSADYRQAGTMRQVFVRIVNEDLATTVPKIKCPVTLVYGSDDNETPYEIGERLSTLIPNASLVVLDGLDHYSILTDGHHQITNLLNGFINSVETT